ncbi:MAG: GspE/PulE family protein [Polyangiaceae bacterium]
MIAARTTSLGFDELLTYLVEARVIASTTARTLLDQEPKQRLLAVRMRTPNAPPSLDEQRRLGPGVSAFELMMSFNVKDLEGEYIREDKIVEVFAERAGVPFVKLDPLKLDAAIVTSVFSKPFARKHGMLVIDADESRVLVATSDPFNALAIEAVQDVARKQVELVVTPPSDIQRLITEFFGFQRSVERAEQDLTESFNLSNLEQFVRMQSEREIEASDQHVVNAVEYLFSYAFQQRASDIHIEPKRGESLVRFRIDGALHQVNKLPAVVHRAVINRIKTLARLDIGEKRRPQDGRIKTEFQNKAVEFRVSTLPVAFGEKAVLRIFDPEIVHDDIRQLGFFEREELLFEKLIKRPHGIVLVTGPTGSGKTTTLYTALRRLANDDVNITTIEDPIEMVFERINQTAVQPTIGISFASALRTILRQDPDIIMVGEIRDLETARNAIQASLTGHLVFSTLHTNDAPSAVARLIDLGIENFLLASTLSGLIAQRLVRKVCSGCAEERSLTEPELGQLGGLLDVTGGALPLIREGAGCVDCRHTGFKGRQGIFEMFEINEAVRELIMQRGSVDAIRAQARADGMLSLREAAVQKMLAGETSLSEVLKVTAVD